MGDVRQLHAIRPEIIEAMDGIQPPRVLDFTACSTDTAPPTTTPAVHQDELIESVLEITASLLDPLYTHGHLKVKAPEDLDVLTDDIERRLRSICNRCNECLEACRPSISEPHPPGPIPNQGPTRNQGSTPNQAPSPNRGKRSKHLLRILVSCLSMHFPENGESTVLSRSIIAGLDDYLKKLLGEILYDSLNEAARGLLDRIPNTRDETFREELLADPEGSIFLRTILIRVLLRFENYQKGKEVFMTVISAKQEKEQRKLTGKDFRLTFYCLFEEIFGLLESERERLHLDFTFGLGTANAIEEIQKAFLRDVGMN